MLLIANPSGTGELQVDWTFVAAVIANLIALAALFKVNDLVVKKARKASIDFHPSGTISVAFGAQGPALEVLGDVLAIHEDQFVRGMRATVTNTKDRSQHEFQWQSSRVSATGPQGDTTSLVFPSGFMAMTTQSWYIDAIFLERQMEEKLQAFRERVFNDWKEFILADRGEEMAYVEAQQDVSTQGFAAYRQWMRGRDPEPLELSFQEFLETKSMREIQSEIDRHCYWEEATYSLTLEITTSRPAITYPQQCQFTLSEKDVKSLRENVGGILRTWCYVPVPYSMNQIVRAEYECNPGISHSEQHRAQTKNVETKSAQK